MENVFGNLPAEVQWNIIKYMRHPVADVFQGVVLKAFDREITMKRWDINYDIQRNPGHHYITRDCQKRLDRLNRYSLYDFFKNDKSDIKWHDKWFLDRDDDDNDVLGLATNTSLGISDVQLE